MCFVSRGSNHLQLAFKTVLGGGNIDYFCQRVIGDGKELPLEL